ncbi:MAG: hypothetical protein Roseis2KO_44560 [Roseivirga sp.]
MSKQRYNLLRIALGCFLGVTIIQVIKETDTVSTGQFVALGLGILAAIFNYLPEKKGVSDQDRS